MSFRARVANALVRAAILVRGDGTTYLRILPQAPDQAQRNAEGIQRMQAALDRLERAIARAR